MTVQYHYGTGYDGGYSNFSTCKHVPKLMWTQDGVDIYAAAKPDITDLDFGVIFNLTAVSITSSHSNPVRGPRPWQELNKFIKKTLTTEVLLDWDDYKAWPAGADFWRALWDTVKASGVKDVLFTCYGGHGRTGSALAALRVVLLGEDAVTAIKTVRALHCKDAVEAMVQRQYMVYLETGHWVDKDPLPREWLSSASASEPKTEAPKYKWLCHVCDQAQTKVLRLQGRQICMGCATLELKTLPENTHDRIKVARENLIRKADERTNSGLGKKGSGATTKAEKRRAKKARRRDRRLAGDVKTPNGQDACDYCARWLRQSDVDVDEHGFNICASCAIEAAEEVKGIQEAEETLIEVDIDQWRKMKNATKIAARNSQGTLECSLCQAHVGKLSSIPEEWLDKEDWNKSIMACDECMEMLNKEMGRKEG